MDLKYTKRTINKLTLYETDLYEGKIVVIPHSRNLCILKSNGTFIQTDTICWKKENNYVMINYGTYNYVLIRKFSNNANVANELYFDIDDLKDKGINLTDFFPIYPNVQILKYYLENNNVSKNSIDKCLTYCSKIDKNFYRNGV